MELLQPPNILLAVMYDRRTTLLEPAAGRKEQGGDWAVAQDADSGFLVGCG